MHVVIVLLCVGCGPASPSFTARSSTMVFRMMMEQRGEPARPLSVRRGRVGVVDAGGRDRACASARSRKGSRRIYAPL